MFEFVDLDGNDPDAKIRETTESWRKRHGDNAPPSAEEMGEMRRIYYRQLSPYLKFTK